MNEFKVGDVVELKTGGPSMTVQSLGGTGTVQGKKLMCSWFDETKKLQEGYFAPETLIKSS